jgi:predicted RNA-binding protein YlqC (UPF0109 family)
MKALRFLHLNRVGVVHQGCTVSSIRTILNVVASRTSRRVVLKTIEEK